VLPTTYLALLLATRGQVVRGEWSQFKSASSTRHLVLIAFPMACIAALAWPPVPPVPAAQNRGASLVAGQTRKNSKDGLDYVWMLYPRMRTCLHTTGFCEQKPPRIW